MKSQNIFYEWLPQTEEVLLLNSAVRDITPSDRTYYDNVVYILTQRQIFGSDALRWTEFRLNEAVDSTKCSYSYWLKFLSSFTCLFVHSHLLTTKSLKEMVQSKDILFWKLVKKFILLVCLTIFDIFLIVITYFNCFSKAIRSKEFDMLYEVSWAFGLFRSAKLYFV